MELTNTSYEGDTKNLRLEGNGRFTFHESSTVYEGELKDGQFHGQGTLIFSNGGRFEAKWEEGKPIDGQYTFSDGLEYSDKDWKYLTKEDRRFYSEITGGLSKNPTLEGSVTLKPLIPGSVDVGDGMLELKTGNVIDYNDTTIVLRKADDKEIEWARTNCRVAGIASAV